MNLQWQSLIYSLWIFSLSVYGSPVFTAKKNEQLPLGSAVQETNANPLLLLISLDGFRRSYLERADEFGLKIPNIRRLMREGSTAEGVHSVYPALTYPAHTSMITGVYPDKHGILENDKFDAEQMGRGLYVFASDVKVPTIFDAAKRANMTTSAVLWPVTAFSKSLDFSLPDLPTRTPVEADFSYHGCIQSSLFRNYVDSVEKLKSLNDTDRVNLALSVLRQPQTANYPRIQALHLIDFDHEQHVNGVFTDAAFKMLEEEDRLVGRVLDALDETGLSSKTFVLLASDHGFTNITKFVAPGVLFASQGLLTDGPNPNWRIYAYNAPGIYAVYINPKVPQLEREVVERKVERIVRYLMSDPEHGIDEGYVGAAAVQRASLRGYPGAFAILEAKPGVVFSPAKTGLVVSTIQVPNYRATHGYNPDYSEMLTNFIIRGPGIKKGSKIESMSLIDIAPTISRLMNLKMENMEGRVLEEVFL